MSKFKRGEDAIDYYDAPTYYCQEPGCDWSQESEWNVDQMAAAKQAGIDHWKAVHGSDAKEPEGFSRNAKRSPDPPEPEKGIDYTVAPWRSLPHQRS